MPKVVIILEAQTQAAVTSIQRFAKAQRDTFDAIKVGNATLADATVKVSKLTESTASAAKGADAARGAFRSLATQGIGQLTSEIPGATTALGGLDKVLGNFPIAITAAIGVGLGFLKMLQGWQHEATKAAAAMAALADTIQSKFQQSVLEVQKIRAQAAGDETKVILLGAEQALQAAEDVKNARIAKAQEAADKLDLLGRKSREAEAALQRERLAAEAEFQGKRMVIEAQGLADLDKLGQQALEKRKQQLEEETKAAAAAAEKQAKLLEDLAAKSLTIFQGLGADFKGVTDALTLAQFVKDSTAALDTLRQAFDQGIIPLNAFTKGTQALQEKMAEAIKLGYVPMIQKATELASAQDLATLSLERTQRALARMAGQATAGPATAGPAAGGAGGGTTSDTPRDWSFLEDPGFQRSFAALGAGLAEDAPRNPSTNLGFGGAFQHGGIVPGIGPIPILAHGGERIIPAGQAGGGAAGVRIEPGAIQISGTVIDQSRNWDVLVESLGQALAARLR